MMLPAFYLKGWITMRGKSLFILVLLFSAGFLLLSGCTTIFSGWREQITEPAERGSVLPEWLLLSHRAQEDLDADVEPVLPELQVSEPGNTDAEEPDLGEGNVTVSPTGEAAAASQQPAVGEQAADEEEEEVKQGTMAWIIEKQREAKAALEEKKKAAEEEEEEEEEKEWWDLDEENGDSYIQYDKN